MPSFGKASLKHYDTLHPDLQKICKEVINDFDFSIICGYRNEEDQNKAFKDGRSNAKFGESLHNEYPSKAVDVIPYPTGFGVLKEQKLLVQHFYAVSYSLRIPIRSGCLFSTLEDWPHIELLEA